MWGLEQIVALITVIVEKNKAIGVGHEAATPSLLLY